MTLLEALIAITAILAVFGIGGYIVLKIIQLIRDWLLSRRGSNNIDPLIRKIEQLEHRQDQLTKRIQNVETILVETDTESSKLQEPVRGNEKDKMLTNRDKNRSLKNKLRS